MSTCTQDGCDRKHSARGLCATHYDELRHFGTTDPCRITVWSRNVNGSACGEPVVTDVCAFHQAERVRLLALYGGVA